MHISACFKIVNKCKISKFARFKLKDFWRIFKYFQAPYLFASTFKGLEVIIPNSSIFKDFLKHTINHVWHVASVTLDLWLPSQPQGSNALNRYQIILLGDRGTSMQTTWTRLLPDTYRMRLRTYRQHARYFLYFTMGREMSPKTAHFPGGIKPPSSTRFVWPTQVHTSNSILISSSVFAQLTVVTSRKTDWQTQRPPRNISNNKLYLMLTTRPNDTA